LVERACGVWRAMRRRFSFVCLKKAINSYYGLQVRMKFSELKAMRYDPIDPELFVRNRAKLVEKLEPNTLVVIHSNDIPPTNADGTRTFRQNNDLFYLTGVDQEETVLVLCPDAPVESEREILFVRETSEHIAVWEGEKLTKEQATAVSGIKNVRWVDTFDSDRHHRGRLP